MALDPISERLRLRHPQRIDLSLERMRRLCQALGNPQDRLPPVIHVAGTNGKGSTVAFIRAMAEAAGLKVHAYTSPHLVRFNERIRLAGDLISDQALNDVLNRVEAATDDGPGQATVFESTTAAAFVAMAEVPADLAVIEVGLGGTLDATNVISRPLVSVIAPVDLDHAEFLGTDLAGVAAEKAGILKAGAPAIVGRQGEIASRVIEAASRRVGARLSQLGVDFDAWSEAGRMAWQGEDRLLDLPLPALTGPHQIDNAGLATAVAVELDLPEAAIAEGLRQVTWPARLQRLNRGPYGERAQAAGAELWLDGGHNPHAGRALALFLSLRQEKAPQPTALVCGLLASKDAGGFFEALAGTGVTVFTCPFDGACVEPSALAAVARGHGLAATPVTSALDGLEQALRLGAGRVVIGGSLYLAGEVLGASPDTWPR